jgi:hypothetical protein
MAEPRVRPFGIPGSLEPSCQNCPNGAALALTVLFYGAGERGFLIAVVRYSREESMFPRALAEALVRAPHECCRVQMLIVQHDPTATIGENAEAVAARIDRAVEEAVAGSPWLTKVHLHLVGFSAGGLLALDTAALVDLRARVRVAAWCGRKMPREVPVEMDLVTIACPFGLAYPFSGTLVSGLPWTYESSVGAGDYRAPAAGRLCSFTALVSSARHGDESPGADRDPGSDPILDPLLDGLDPTKKRIVLLRETYTPADPDDPSDPERVTHVQLLERALGDFPWALLPRCACVQTF